MSSTIERELESVPLEDAVVDTATDTETPVGGDETPPPAETPPADPPVPSDAPPDDGKDDVTIGGVRVDRFGRMHRADGTVMSKTEQDAAAARTAPAPVTAPADAPKNEPYVQQVFGRAVDDFPGALRSPKGELYFPAEHRQKVETLIARGYRYDEFRAQSAQAKQELDVVNRRTQAEAKALEETLLVHVSTPDALAALAQRVQEVGPVMAHKELSLAIREAALAVDREFGNGGAGRRAATAETAEHSTPLDRDGAFEVFDGYWRDQLARPEFHGMPVELQQLARDMLAALPFPKNGSDPNAFWSIDRDGDWVLNEGAADHVWDRIGKLMARERSISSATASNAGRRPNSTAPSRIPPTAASPSPVGSGTTRLTGKKPARVFDNPFDAIRHADLSED